MVWLWNLAHALVAIEVWLDEWLHACGHFKCNLLLAQARPRMIQHLTSNNFRVGWKGREGASYRLCAKDLVVLFQGFSPAKLIACDIKCRCEAHSTCCTLVELKGSHMVTTWCDCSEYTHGTNSLLHYVEALMQWLGNWQQEFGHMCVALVFNVVVDQCWLRFKKLSSQMWENTYHWQRTNQPCNSTVHLPHLGVGKRWEDERQSPSTRIPHTTLNTYTQSCSSL